MRPIAEYETVDREHFEREVVARGEPALLRGLVKDWPIVEAALGGDDQLVGFLSDVAAEEPFEAWFGEPAIEGHFGYNEDFTGFNHDRRLVTVAQLLDLLVRQKGHERPYSMYAGGIPVRRHLPGLLRTIPVPLLDMNRATLISLWLGNRARTAAHWDLPQNLACVVGGRRRFTLFPTDQLPNLYVGPLEFTLAGQPISLVDVENPDLSEHPRFAASMEVAQQAELGPGDALYIPSMWWHAVHSLDEVAAMINFWWRYGESPLLTPLNALYHSVITMKNLPPKELAAWRVLFGHYVFGDNGDPAGHLPGQARGILGRRTPELVARVKRLLIEALSR